MLTPRFATDQCSKLTVRLPQLSLPRGDSSRCAPQQTRLGDATRRWSTDKDSDRASQPPSWLGRSTAAFPKRIVIGFDIGSMPGPERQGGHLGERAAHAPIAASMGRARWKPQCAVPEARQSVGTISRDADPARVRRRRSALSCRGLLARGAETNASLAKEVDFGTFDCACSDCRALYWARIRREMAFHHRRHRRADLVDRILYGTSPRLAACLTRIDGRWLPF